VIRRKSKEKLVRPTFFVFCEGESEEAYIKHLKSMYRLPIEIVAKVVGNQINEKYISDYKKTKGVQPKDKTYLMYDLDVNGMLEKLQKIKKTTLLVSNPCFELWYLLHFQNQTAELSSKECEDKLVKHIKTYHKGNICNELKIKLNNNQNDAISKAKTLKIFNNPSSEIYVLIDDLENEKFK
jgi:ribosomal protein S8